MANPLIPQDDRKILNNPQNATKSTPNLAPPVQYKPKDLNYIPKDAGTITGEGLKRTAINSAKSLGNVAQGTGEFLIGKRGVAETGRAIDNTVNKIGHGINAGINTSINTANRVGNKVAQDYNSSEYGLIGGIGNVVKGLAPNSYNNDPYAPNLTPASSLSTQDKLNAINSPGKANPFTTDSFRDKLKPTASKQYNSGNMNDAEAKALFDEFDKIPENKDPIVTSVNTVMKNGVPTYTANIAPGQNSSGSTVLGGGQQASINTSAGNKFLQSQPVQPSSKLHPDASNGYRVTYDDLVNAGQQNEGGIDVYHGSTLENVNTNGQGGRGTMPTYHPESSPAPEVYQPRGLSKAEIVGLRRNGVNLSDLADYEQAKVQASQYNYLDWAAREKARNGDLEGAQAIQMQMKELGAKIASDQADRGLRKQALALERDKYNSSLVPKRVTPEYMPIYDERTDADGVRSKRLVGHTNKNTGLFEPIDEAKMPRNDRAIYEKYQQALKAGHNQEEALKAYFSDMGYN